MGISTTQVIAHPNKNILSIPSLHQQLTLCTELENLSSHIYGNVHLVEYYGIKLMVQQLPHLLAQQSDSITNNPNSSLNKQIYQTPPKNYVHYLINSNLMIIPTYTLFENYRIDNYDQENKLLELISSVSKLSLTTKIGLGRNKICLPNVDMRAKLQKLLKCQQQVDQSSITQWRVTGFDYGNPYWNYQSLLQNSERKSDVYLSPELMYAYSKDKIYPKIDIQKSDVFILAIMVLEILFDECLLDKVYNYSGFQIRLKPVLSKLSLIQEKFSEFVYRLFVKMLEFQPTQRISFEQIIQSIEYNYKNYKSPHSPQFISKQGQPSFQIMTPINCKPKTGSPFLKECGEKDKQARNKGRSPGAIRKNFNGNERSGSVSPYQRRKRSFPINNLTPQLLEFAEQNQNRTRAIEPFGLIQHGHGRREGTRRSSLVQNKQKTMKTIRY